MNQEDRYIKTYYEGISKMRKLPVGMGTILLTMLTHMSKNNIITSYKPFKRVVCEELGITMSYLEKSITEFYHSRIFFRLDRGVYIVNPHFFSKENWTDTKKLRKTFLEMENITKTLKLEIPKETTEMLIHGKTLK